MLPICFCVDTYLFSVCRFAFHYLGQTLFPPYFYSVFINFMLLFLFRTTFFFLSLRWDLLVLLKKRIKIFPHKIFIATAIVLDSFVLREWQKKKISTCVPPCVRYAFGHCWISQTTLLIAMVNTSMNFFSVGVPINWLFAERGISTFHG